MQRTAPGRGDGGEREALPIKIGVIHGQSRRIIKGVDIKGYEVNLIWELNIGKFQTAITRHHCP